MRLEQSGLASAYIHTTFVTECDKSLLQNGSGFLSQNATVLLQNTTVIKKAAITKCNVYYK